MAVQEGKTHNLFYPPYPVLTVVSDGKGVFLTAGGGGAAAKKEVPNVVQVHIHDPTTSKLSTIGSLGTGALLVVNITYAEASGLWLASARGSCKILSFNAESNELVELCDFVSESEGKEPTQNFAQCSKAGDMVATGGTDGCVKLWTMGKHGEAPTLHHTCEKGKEVFDADFNADGSLVAACDKTGVCRIWKTRSGEDAGVVKYTGASKGPVFIKWVRFVTNADGTSELVVLAVDYRGPSRIAIFGLDGSMRNVVSFDCPVTGFTLDSGKESVAVALINRKTEAPFLSVYSVRGLKRVKSTRPLHTQTLPASCVTFLNKTTVVTGSGDRSIHISCLEGGDSSTFGTCFNIIYYLALLVVVIFFILRIAGEGARVGQGQIEL